MGSDNREDPFADQGRIKTYYGNSFPPSSQTLTAPSIGKDGRRLYFGSAFLTNTHIRPSKVSDFTKKPECRYALNGKEVSHPGQFSILPFDTRKFELVPATNGQLPLGRRPVTGGFDENGEEMFHCLVYAGPSGQERDLPGLTSIALVSHREYLIPGLLS